jgi:hypothetical protein
MPEQHNFGDLVEGREGLRYSGNGEETITEAQWRDKVLEHNKAVAYQRSQGKIPKEPKE